MNKVKCKSRSKYKPILFRPTKEDYDRMKRAHIKYGVKFVVAIRMGLKKLDENKSF